MSIIILNVEGAVVPERVCDIMAHMLGEAFDEDDKGEGPGFPQTAIHQENTWGTWPDGSKQYALSGLVIVSIHSKTRAIGYYFTGESRVFSQVSFEGMAPLVARSRGVAEAHGVTP